MKPREFWIDGHRVLIDEQFEATFLLYSWHVYQDKQTHYVRTNFYHGGKNISVPLHRLLTGMRNCAVDHKNRNGLDNRLENLRFATATENSYNRVRKNKYGYRGVYKHGSSFAYQIQANGKRVSEYGFETPEAAAKAYDIKNKELHGEFGIRNFKD